MNEQMRYGAHELTDYHPINDEIIALIIIYCMFKVKASKYLLMGGSTPAQKPIPAFCYGSDILSSNRFGLQNVFFDWFLFAWLTTDYSCSALGLGAGRRQYFFIASDALLAS